MASILLFGPAGVGKSTIIKKLSKSFNTVDLEDHQPLNDRVDSLISAADFVGAANLDPNSPTANKGVKILLYLDHDNYIKRRHIRDTAQPEKKNQKEDSPDRWLALSDWDYILTPDKNVIKKLVTLKRS